MKIDAWVVYLTTTLQRYPFLHATKEEALDWFKGDAFGVEPVCLISPEKAEWIEKVKKLLQEDFIDISEEMLNRAFLLKELDSIEQRERGEA